MASPAATASGQHTRTPFWQCSRAFDECDGHSERNRVSVTVPVGLASRIVPETEDRPGPDCTHGGRPGGDLGRLAEHTGNTVVGGPALGPAGPRGARCGGRRRQCREEGRYAGRTVLSIRGSLILALPIGRTWHAATTHTTHLSTRFPGRPEPHGTTRRCDDWRVADTRRSRAPGSRREQVRNTTPKGRPSNT